jgi:hypothetical protein|nr:hypothetical protein [Kofleriaceae bacterium]
MKTTILGLVALAACGAPQPKPPVAGEDKSGPVQEAADRDDCTTDADCTLVDACCGCGAGGRKVGLRMDALTAYEKNRPNRCKDVACAAVMSDHPSCNAEPVCRKGHCRAQAHMNQGSASDIPPAGPTTTP